MAHNENAEWEEFSALLDDVVPDTSDATKNSQSDASHDAQTYAQAQEELQSGYTYDDDSDLEEVDVDQFAMEPQAEMEDESRTTAQRDDPTQKALATVLDVADAPVQLSSGSSSTAMSRSVEPQSEAAANRARATERGYLARRRAARKSASLKTAQKEAASQAGSETPRTPTSVPTPSASSSTSTARPAPSSSRAAPSPATLPPPLPLPVGPTGRRQLWEGELKLGLPHLKAGYRIALPPARPASAPVVGAASAGPVPQVGARHQSAPVAPTSRGKRSREQEDRGDEVVQKRPKVTNAQSRKRAKASAPSPSGSTPRPQWIPYAAPQAELSRLHGSAPAAQPNAAREQQQTTRHQPAKQVPQPAQPRRAGLSTETSRETNGTPMNRAGREGSAAYTMRLPPPPTLQRPPQVTPGPGPSHRSDEPRTSAQTYARPAMPSSWHSVSSIPRTFSSAVLSASASVETGNRTHSEVDRNATGPQQRRPEMPQAGPSRRAYEQPYEDVGLQHPYGQPESPQSYMTPVPSGWNDPAAVPRTFTRAGSSVPTVQTEGNSMYRRAQEAPVAYAARPQQMERSVPPMYRGGMAPTAEQPPNVDAPGGRPVYNQPYAPPMPMGAGWRSNVQLQAMSMSGGETVPDYLTIYAPPNYPPPGWNPQAPVYDQEPSAQSFSRGQSAYGYGYDF